MGRKTANSKATADVVTAQQSQSSSYGGRQAVIRKKGNPVSIRSGRLESDVAEAMVDVVQGIPGLSITGQPNYQNPLDAFPRQNPNVAPYKLIKNPSIDPALLQSPSPQRQYVFSDNKTATPPNKCPSTPGKKRPHADSNDESVTVTPKRLRELANERAARAKRNDAENRLRQSRAALPRYYRSFAETRIPVQYGPRTKEVDGENPLLDSKMYIADEMVRSAVAIDHLGLILKYNGLEILNRAVEMEEAEKSKLQAGPSNAAPVQQPPVEHGNDGFAVQGQVLVDPALLAFQPSFTPEYPFPPGYTLPPDYYPFFPTYPNTPNPNQN